MNSPGKASRSTLTKTTAASDVSSTSARAKRSSCVPVETSGRAANPASGTPTGGEIHTLANPAFSKTFSLVILSQRSKWKVAFENLENESHSKLNNAWSKDRTPHRKATHVYVREQVVCQDTTCRIKPV